MDTLIELKSKAYDAAVQVREWQRVLDDLNNQITNYKLVVEELPKEQQNGSNETDLRRDRQRTKK